jgi:hypothetical protein
MHAGMMQVVSVLPSTDKKPMDHEHMDHDMMDHSAMGHDKHGEMK